MKTESFRWWRRELFTTSALAAILMAFGHGLLMAQDPATDEGTDLDDPDEPTLEEILRLVDDAEIESTFKKGLKKLMDDGKTGDAKDLRRQLESRHSCKLDLPTPTSAIPLLPEDVFGALHHSVLCLGSLYDCGKCEHWHARIAGGVVLSDDGVVVTCYHIMAREDAAAYGALSKTGNVYPITEVLAASKENDLALVKLDVDAVIPGKLVGAWRSMLEDTIGGAQDEETELLMPAILSLDDPVGSPVWAISHPSGHYFSLTTGVISRYHKKASKNGGDHLIRMSITADFARGSSGCGVFNGFGKLSALVRSTRPLYYDHEDGEGKNLQMVIKDCIPARTIKALIEEPEDE